jgi:hypothetical protein
LGLLSHETDNEADDELFLEPDEINAQRDPAVQLERSRAAASFKLKSRWEHIFEKYEKDFSGEDDEIDMATGEVVVDNGHIRSLPDQEDAKSVAASESADLEDEERILHGKGVPGGQLIRPASSLLMPYPSYAGRLSALGSFTGLPMGPPRLSTMFSSGLQFSSFGSFGASNSFLRPAETAWNAPELPAEAFYTRTVAKRRVTKRIVAAKPISAAGDEDSDDDDIIMGGSAWRREEGQGKAQKELGDKSPQLPSTVLRKPAEEEASQIETISDAVNATQPATDVEEVGGKSKHARPGRKPKAWKRNKVYSSAQKSSRKRSEAVAVSDTDGEFIRAPDVVADHPDVSNGLMNDAPTAKPRIEAAKPRSRLEVHLVRRSRQDIIRPTQSVPDRPSLASRPMSGKEQPAQLVGKRTSGEQRPRTLPLHPTPAPSKDMSDNRKKAKRRPLPAPPTIQLRSPAKTSPAQPQQEDDVIPDSQDHPESEVAEHSQPAPEPETRPDPMAEVFSRNTIDEAYDFSDENESWAPLSRVKKSAKPNSLPKSASSRGSVKRVPKPAWNPASSPSIRAYPVVKNRSRTSKQKSKEDTSGQRAAPEKASSNEILTSVVQPTPELESPPTQRAQHAKPSSRRVDELSSSPLGPKRKPSQPDQLPITPTSDQSKEHLPPPAPPVVTPSSYQHKEGSASAAMVITPSSRQSKSIVAATTSAARPSTSKRSIMSLISDSEEDELSLNLTQIIPLARSTPVQQVSLVIRNRGTAKKLSVKRRSLGPHTKQKQKLRPSTGWMSSSTPRSGMRISESNVGGDMERTPGGTMRRCGEGGFKCERDFCFACL